MTRFVSLFRPALVAAGGFLFAGNILSLGRPAKFSDAALTPMFEVSSALLLLGAVAVLVALVALHARQADQVGAFGLFAALVAGAGTVLFSGVCWSQTFLDPAAAKVVPAPEHTGTSSKTPRSRRCCARSGRSATVRPSSAPQSPPD
jgi:amino acid transporter